MICLDDVAKENNEYLLRYFVSCVGADYKTDYSPNLWPEFSNDTMRIINKAVTATDKQP